MARKSSCSNRKTLEIVESIKGEGRARRWSPNGDRFEGQHLHGADQPRTSEVGVQRNVTAAYAINKEYDFSKMKELKNPYAGKKQAVGINLSPEVVDYFKGLANETGLPYQK